MTSLVFDKLEALSRQDLTLQDVLTLSLPLALDGLDAKSEIWMKFRDVVFSNQSHMSFNDWILLAQSFSQIKDGQDQNEKLWTVIQSQFISELKKNPGTVINICNALTNVKHISPDLLGKIEYNLGKADEIISSNIESKEIVMAFLQAHEVQNYKLN